MNKVALTEAHKAFLNSKKVHELELKNVKELEIIYHNIEEDLKKIKTIIDDSFILIDTTNIKFSKYPTSLQTKIRSKLYLLLKLRNIIIKILENNNIEKVKFVIEEEKNLA